MIIVAMAVFLIGLYKNIVSKIAFVLWVNNPDPDPKAYRDTRVGLPFPDKSTVINEAVLQKRIRDRSPFLWARHVLIFFGFISIFIFDQSYFILAKVLHVEYFVSGAGRAFLKFGLELSGTVLFIGLTLALLHRIIYHEEEKVYVDLRLVSLLWAVVFTGFLTEALRFVLEPHDAFIWCSFIAAPLSRLLANYHLPWEALATFIWIVHATIVAAFFAYIPYSKFVHIFVAPIGRSITMGQDTGKLKREKISEGLL